MKIIDNKKQAYLLLIVCLSLQFFHLFPEQSAYKQKSAWHHFSQALLVWWNTITQYPLNYFENTTNIKMWHKPCSIPVQKSQKPIITWIGHSTFLIQLNDINILTDPIFYDLSIFHSRQTQLGVCVENLPPIHAIILSHNHQDHFNKKSLSIFKKYNPLILTPKGTANWFKKNKFSNIIEFEWENQVEYNGVTFTFLPALHWSGSNLLNFNKSWFGSWIISTHNFNIYFAGDSAYNQHYSDIYEKYDNIDVALLPIGPNEPNKHTSDSHMNVQDSINAFIDLKAKYFVPMHWGTYKLGPDSFEKPIKQLIYHWNKSANLLIGRRLYLVKFGDQIEFQV